jgi:hypothetical protein
MRVILLAGYKGAGSGTGADAGSGAEPRGQAEVSPWLGVENGRPILETRIREAFELGHQCIVVLAGADADQALRTCPSLEKCELVFDTNSSPGILSNLKAALKLGADPAIVHPAELPFGRREDIKRLVGWAAQQGNRSPSHILQAALPGGSLANQGFPLVVTTSGCQEILRNTTLSGLADDQLRREPVSGLPRSA